MKWTVLASILFCAANFVTALSFLAVSSYNLSSTQSRYPIRAVENWRNYLCHTVGISILIMVIAAFSCWGVTRTRNTCVAVTILILHFTALGICTVYCDLVTKEVDRVATKAEVLKNYTLHLYEESRNSPYYDKNWLPEWLDGIQAKSKTCCGIIGYEDWREFRPEMKNKVPTSCCRNEQRCISDFEQINWPEKRTDYIKNDEGCAGAINNDASKRIKETLKFLIVLVVLLIFSIFGFGTQYVREFCLIKGTQGQGGDTCNDGNDDVGYFSCLAWLSSRFGSPKKNNNPPAQDDTAGDGVNFEQMPEEGTYSYTFLQQLQQSKPCDINGQDDSPSPLQGQPRKTFETSIKAGSFYSPTSIVSAPPPPQQQFQQQSSGQPYKYEVLQNMSNSLLNSGANSMPMTSGSSQSLPDDQTAPNAPDEERPNPSVPLPYLFPDDTEKQNLKQLLRFGRRHRRHRKIELDPERNEQA